MEQVDIFNSSYELIRFILSETLNCINKRKIESFDDCQYDELEFGFLKALKRIDRLTFE